MNDTPILKVENLSKKFVLKKAAPGKEEVSVKAVNHVSFSLHKKETIGLVGETGCGKSTTGRAILRLVEPTAGHVYYQDTDITELKKSEIRKLYVKMQMIFQDPYSSLNPRIPIGKIVEEPLIIHGLVKDKHERMQRTLEMLEKVGIRPDQYYRYPHEFSGGQRQRIGIARALIVKPEIVICDEPVSALDVSIQSQVLNLLAEIQEEMDVSYIFISHDMSVVRHVSDRICVMYLGNIVEEAETDELFEHPLHPYTQALLSAIPAADPDEKQEKIKLEGEIPSPINPPAGCPFHNRCKHCKTICTIERPERREVAPGHFVACHNWTE